MVLKSVVLGCGEFGASLRPFCRTLSLILLSVLTIGLPTISALNNTCYTDQQTGTDLGLRIAACQAVLSTAGGIINATGETGAQSAAATITLSKPVTLMLGNYNLTLNGNPGINMNAVGASIIGL